MPHARAGTARTLSRVREAFGDAPFTRRQAAGVGLTAGQLRAALAAGRLRQVRRGVYSAPKPHDPGPTSDLDGILGEIRSVLSILGDTPYAVTGPAGARVLDVPLITPPTRRSLGLRIDILVPESFTPHEGTWPAVVRVRRVPALPPGCTTVHGIRVVDPLHAAIDVVRLGFGVEYGQRGTALMLPEALAPLDAATASAGCRTPEEAARRIQALRSEYFHCPGIRAVDAYAEFVDPRAESPLESWSRGHMIVQGIPPPDLQREVRGADGRLYRVDFLWEEYGVIGEADGLGKYGTDPVSVRRALAEERARHQALEAAGWIVVRWTWDELARDPASVIARIRAALQHRSSHSASL